MGTRSVSPEKLLDVAMRLRDDLIQMDLETAIELDKWPAAEELVSLLEGVSS